MQKKKAFTALRAFCVDSVELRICEHGLGLGKGLFLSYYWYEQPEIHHWPK